MKNQLETTVNNIPIFVEYEVENAFAGKYKITSVKAFPNSFIDLVGVITENQIYKITQNIRKHEKSFK